MEVIVVVDVDRDPDLPSSEGVRVLRTSGQVGPSHARQIGVELAKGDVIALLDDDDAWRPHKLEKQLAAVPEGDEWIVSCRYLQHEHGRRPQPVPRRLIRIDEPIAEYLFKFNQLRRGRNTLAAPTLVFPRAVADKVPLSVSAGSIHDDPLWLMEVRRVLPELPIVQVSDILVDVDLHGSVSRPGLDRSQEYIDWGLCELADQSSRVRGDYLLTNPAGAALRGAGSLRGIARSMAASLRWARPGPWAWGYASSAMVRIVWRRARSRAVKLGPGVRQERSWSVRD